MRKIICKQPGCCRTIDPSTGHKYCPEHQAQERAELERKKIYMPHVERGSWDELYHTPEWRTLRAEKLRQTPNCEICGEPATEVHHKIPHKGNRDIFLDWDNLQSICNKCHRLQTIKENLPKCSLPISCSLVLTAVKTSSRLFSFILLK